jgi:hypothetical protein
MRSLRNLFANVPSFIRRLPKRLTRGKPQPAPAAPLAEKAVETPPVAETPPAEAAPPAEGAEEPPEAGPPVKKPRRPRTRRGPRPTDVD